MIRSDEDTGVYAYSHDADMNDSATDDNVQQSDAALHESSEDSSARTAPAQTSFHAHHADSINLQPVTCSSPHIVDRAVPPLLSPPPIVYCGLSPMNLARLLLSLLFFGCCVSAVVYFSELRSFFLTTLTYVRDLGPVMGSLVLCAANIVGALLFMPCIPFTLGAGFLYGTLIGSAIVSIASTIAAVLAFLTARYLARSWIEKTLASATGSKTVKLRVLDSAIREDGFRIVLLIRSSPLHPYGFCNYLLGLTSVSMRDYTLASFIGMLPGTMMEVYLGTAMKNVSDIINGRLENSWLSRVLFWAGLIVTIIVTIAITLILKRKLKSELSRYQKIASSEAEADEGECMDGADTIDHHLLMTEGSSSDMERAAPNGFATSSDSHQHSRTPSLEYADARKLLVLHRDEPTKKMELNGSARRSPPIIQFHTPSPTQAHATPSPPNSSHSPTPTAPSPLAHAPSPFPSPPPPLDASSTSQPMPSPLAPFPFSVHAATTTPTADHSPSPSQTPSPAVSVSVSVSHADADPYHSHANGREQAARASAATQ